MCECECVHAGMCFCMVFDRVTSHLSKASKVRICDLEGIGCMGDGWVDCMGYGSWVDVEKGRVRTGGGKIGYYFLDRQFLDHQNLYCIPFSSWTDRSWTVSSWTDTTWTTVTNAPGEGGSTSCDWVRKVKGSVMFCNISMFFN